MMLLNEAEKRFTQSVSLLTGLCLAFLLGRYLISGTGRFWFIPGNLALAWLGLIFGWLFAKQLGQKRWKSWHTISLGVLWLVFLPNTWYVLTDFVHVTSTGEISELYDIVTMSLLVIIGFILGFTSLYLVHKQLLKRFSELKSILLVLAVVLIASFGIYLGRDLRWNTWDVVSNPSGIILNVSDRLIDPFGHPRAINVTSLFFVLISGIYLSVWLFLRPAPSSRERK
jgi:uncharacterized membrane protein